MTGGDPLRPPEARLRWPAEWEPQEALWLTWPQNEETWAPVRGRVESCYDDIVASVVPRQRVNLLAGDEATRSRLLKRYERLREQHGEKLQVLLCPTDDSWIRDYGALTVEASGSGGPRRLMVDFRFNSWGGKYPPWNADDRVGEFMAAHEGIPSSELDFVLEGGSIDTNGQGLLLTTRNCLLNKNRNPDYNQGHIEEILCLHLGAEEVLWIEEGICGDDTDGHVDDIARFADARTVMAAVEHSSQDENYVSLKRNWKQLERIASTRKLELVELPMPQPVVVADLRTPASYANFLIVNGAVLVPVFNSPREDQVLDTFAAHFPGRDILPIDCRPLVYGQGAIHCSSMHQAA